MASPNSASHCQGGTNDDSSSFSREKVSRKRRNEDEVDEKKKKNNESSLSVKKGRLQWTPELHQIFVNADKQLGDKNTPKNILELMGVEGLTRDKIASHLQKYRQGKQKKVNKSATAVHLQQNMAISNNYVASSEELHLKNHSIGNTMLMPMAGEKYGYAADPRITNWRNLLPPLDWSNYPFGTQNNTPSPLMPPPQQPLFRPMEENLQTHFLPNNMIGGIPPPPHLMVHHQGYSSAAAPAGDVGGVNQQQLHPNSIPNPGFGNVESYLNTNGQDPLSQVAEQEQPNRRVKIENRRETTENKEETSATGKLNTGGSRFDAKGETTWSSLPASDT